MDILLFCFETAFPYKRVKLQEIGNNRWLSKGLIVSSKRIKILNNLKRTFTYPNEGGFGEYQKYQKRIKEY
jgi:hypothetical protein